MTAALPVFTERDFYRRPRKIRSDKGQRRPQTVMPNRRDLNPDFVPSLRLLVCREQYSQTDIGLMFGVSRERVRQWCVKYNIQPPLGSHYGKGLFALRVWDDTANRFRPIPKSVLNETRNRLEVGARRKVRHGVRDARQQRRREGILSAAVRLKAELGRDPTWLEIATAVRGKIRHPKSAAMYVVHLWDTSAKTIREKYADIRAALDAVGVNARGVGGAGHISRSRASASHSAQPAPQSVEVPRDGAPEA